MAEKRREVTYNKDVKRTEDTYTKSMNKINVDSGQITHHVIQGPRDGADNHDHRVVDVTDNNTIVHDTSNPSNVGETMNTISYDPEK